MTITLAEWVSDPEGVVDGIFAVDGPLSKIMPGYAVNPHQVRYAKLLAVAAVRGIDPLTAGRVTPVEGGTGLGKSLAILIVTALNAALRGKRGLVTTYTRFLNRQLAGKDGETACTVVAELVGHPISIAVRRPRSAFASPTLCLHQAQVIENEIRVEGLVGDDLESRRCQIDVLKRLAEWTTDSAMGILDLEGDLLPPDMTTDYIRDFGGLIETFVSLNDDARIPLQEIPFDLYTLNGVSGKGEQQAYEAYARIAVGAHVLIATHAALVRDMSFSGRLLDHEGIGFSMIVCDEANHLENAGVLALGTKRALSSFRRDIQIVTPFLDKVSDRIRIDVTARLLELNAEGERMLALLQAIRDAADNARHEIVVEGNEAWLTILRDLHERSTQIVDTLKTSPNADIKAVATRLSNRNRDVGVFLDCIRRRETAALIGRAARLDPQDVPYAVPLLTFSPHAHEPSVLARPKKGSRILSRLWSQETPRADAVFLTSATLGMPARAGGASHTTILENVGIEPTSPRINFDLAQSVEMTKFGTLKALMLAGPNTPTPSLPKGQRRDGNHRNPDWLRFVAERIHEALQDVWRSDLKNRVAVLCTSFDEAAAIGELCDELVGPGKLYVRRRHDAVDDGFDWLAQQKTGVLVTTGAFDGIDRPGLIDHLVVPRLPFPSRPGGLYKQFTDATGELRYSRRTEEMLMALKQAFGRPFRKQTDAAKIWVLDPRIGLPAETNMIAHPLSDNRYLNAVPMRFRHIVENAVILARNPGEIER